MMSAVWVVRTQLLWNMLWLRHTALLAKLLKLLAAEADIVNADASQLTQLI